MTSNQMAGEIVIVEMQPKWSHCRRCDTDTLDRCCWPYYEDFIHSESTIYHGYVLVCRPCHDWLVANEHALWKRAA